MKKKRFDRMSTIINIPNLIEVQKQSFEDFLQRDVEPEKRKRQGLQAAFLDIFPLSNIDQSLVLEFVDYTVDKPKFDEKESLEKDITYSVPVKMRVRLKIRIDEKKNPIVKEQEIYLCDLPFMTITGTFIVNGAERVIVNQLHRSPGVIFEEDIEKKISSLGKRLYIARVIPYRGAWVEFEFDNNNLLYVRIDKKRRILSTVLLRALGLETNEQILKKFYHTKTMPVKGRKREDLIGLILSRDLKIKGGKGQDSKEEIYFKANTRLDEDMVNKIKEAKVDKIEVLDIDPTLNDVAIHFTLKRDHITSRSQAILDIFRRLRAQEYITEESAKLFFETLLFKTIKKYDLTKVGRYKINKKLNEIFKEMKLEEPATTRRTLCLNDIVATIRYLLNLNNGISGEIDDIDHLGNRRVRSVGEQLENQVRIGLSHMGRLIREKMNIQNLDNVTPRDIINTSPVVGIIKKFFGTSQLSQFMDQTNPLAELTHKRRLSALGPGGLNRKRAGFEVRDVHHSHYGRICPIETPEGPNIGLITSLSIYSRINEYGLIESPYRRVSHGKVTENIDYLTADEEDEYVIAQANVPVSTQDNRFKTDLIAVRKRGDVPLVPSKEVDYMDVSPKQLVGISAGLIPFLEHDDANRALMGSNMQRQAVPLMVTEGPLISTGIEGNVAVDSGVVITAKRSGRVISVTGDKVVIWSDNEDENRVDFYQLNKYSRSNQDTCINQVPIVKSGDYVRKGQVIADGPGTSLGELALGKNLLVAFMPWGGYNFEDAILINERLVREDIFTSVHIQEFETEARDLKIGSEEITRDIPNVGEDALRNLDENGIVCVGAYVKPGDILVGKVTPKGETQTTPEERLLKVIFGKKAEDVRDASLRVSPGIEGKVLTVKVFSRKGKTTKAQEAKFIKMIDEEKINAINAIRKWRKEEISQLQRDLESKDITKSEYNEQKNRIEKVTEAEINEIKSLKKKELENFRRGDDLPVTVNKKVKVFIVSRRKVTAGDKLAGRHGNKGVVSRILPEEDMPYLPDGTPVDIVLNPLSVPSRMNVGQILETQLGWASKVLDTQMISPVFDGAKEVDIREQLKEAGLPEDSNTVLFDGRTGIPMEGKVTVGYMYIMKLSHLVEDKIHARSIGPYSLITRQPLGGKAQFGGQRFGEMEVWAIEGYGAAHTLQEFLTMKSDDVVGRTKMYESIIRGEVPHQPGIPESFKVLVKELQSLCLNVNLLKREEKKESKK